MYNKPLPFIHVHVRAYLVSDAKITKECLDRVREITPTRIKDKVENVFL